MSNSGRTLLFVRHGQSLANAGGPTMDNALIPLTELGQSQARDVAGRLPARPTRVLSSTYLRALDTARAYAQRTGMPVETDPMLRVVSSIDADLLLGMTGVQRRPIALRYQQAADPQLRMGPRAETFAEFDQRVQAFIEDQLPDLADGSVLFGHGQWMGLLGWKLQGHSAAGRDGMRAYWDYMARLPMPNTAVYRLQEGPTGPCFERILAEG